MDCVISDVPPQTVLAVVSPNSIRVMSCDRSPPTPVQVVITCSFTAESVDLHVVCPIPRTKLDGIARAVIVTSVLARTGRPVHAVTQVPPESTSLNSVVLRVAFDAEVVPMAEITSGQLIVDVLIAVAHLNA